MMKDIESSGKTREQAIENGLKELGVDMHDLDKIDIIDEGSKGFLGIGARPVRVKLTVDVPEKKSRRGDNRQGGQERRGGGGHQERRGDKPQQQQKQRQEKRGDGGGKRQERQPDKSAENKEDRDGGRRKKRRKRGGGGGGAPENRNEKSAGGRKQQGNAHKASPIVGGKNKSVTDEAAEALHRAQNFENNDADAPVTEELPPNARPEDDIETITDEQGKEAAAMLSEILGLMELNGDVAFQRVADGSARLAVDSEEDGGILIGKRGVTLHAIQYLVNRMIALNEASDSTERVVVDVGGYVDRRHNTLADMARSMAKRAKDSGRNVRLKPLSPQERRIVHLTLEPDPQVRTYSMGDSLFRSIVINPVGARGGGSGRRDRNPRERKHDADDASADA